MRNLKARPGATLVFWRCEVALLQVWARVAATKIGQFSFLWERLSSRDRRGWKAAPTEMMLKWPKPSFRHQG